MNKFNVLTVLGFLAAAAAAPAQASQTYSCQGNSGLRQFTVEVADGSLGEVTFYAEGSEPRAHTYHLEQSSCEFNWCWNTLVPSSPAAGVGAPTEPARLGVSSQFMDSLQSQQLLQTTVMIYVPMGTTDPVALACVLENQ